MSRIIANLATTTVLNLLATLFVVLRAISRFRILRASHIDDYLIIVGVSLSWCLTALTFLQVHFGLGRHQDQVSPADLQNYYICFYTFYPVYNIALTFAKLSALFQFLRFFPTQGTRLSAWVSIVFVASYGVAVSVGSLCSCLPVQSFWIVELPGRCIDLEIFWYFNSSFNVMTDVGVVALPLYVLKDLRLPRRQKLAVLGVFAIGTLTCVTSIIRLYSVSILIKGDDNTYDNDTPTMWSTVEVNTAIICACMQSLKPLVQKVRPKWLAQSESSSNRTVSSGSVWNSKRTRGTANNGIHAEDTFNIESTDTTISKQSHGSHRAIDGDLYPLTAYRL